MKEPRTIEDTLFEHGMGFKTLMFKRAMYGFGAVMFGAVIGQAVRTYFNF